MSKRYLKGPWTCRPVVGHESAFDVFDADGNFLAVTDSRREEIARLIAAAPETAAERDRLKMSNAKLFAALKELVEVADLRGDSDIPHPCDDPKTWSARMADAWGAARDAIAEHGSDNSSSEDEALGGHPDPEKVAEDADRAADTWKDQHMERGE